MPKVEVLCNNEWVSLHKVIDKKNHINGYVYSHETRCKGKIISIMPFRFMEDKEGIRRLELLLRKEVTPCWATDQQITSTITGGVEHTDEFTAINELWEEAGYKIIAKELIPLGYCFATKSSDTRYTIYTVDLTGKKKEGLAKGDGSKIEELGTCEWVDENILNNVWDPLASVAFVRLLHLFKQMNNNKKGVK